MNTIKTVMEPWDADQVSKALEASLDSMKRALLAIASQRPEKNIMSTPVQWHVFFVHNDKLLCLPSEFIHQGIVDEAAVTDAFSVIELDLSVTVQRTLIESIDAWVARPSYAVARVDLTVA